MSEPAEITISAVLPVHGRADKAHFADAVRSLVEQIHPPDEIVIVEDGPLGRGLQAVVEEAGGGPGPVLTRVRLVTNQGAGVANQAGLEAASGRWIVKADSDDVSLPRRVGRQLAAVREAGADICGSSMLEFRGSIDNVVSRRTMPGTPEAIARRVMWNSPVNHPTAFYSRELALSVGGYPDWRYMQDYGLFARMFSAGATMINLSEDLVCFRSGAAVARRRREPEILRLERVVQAELVRLGIVSKGRARFNHVWRGAFRRLPEPLIQAVSSRVLASPYREDRS